MRFVPSPASAPTRFLAALLAVLIAISPLPSFATQSSGTASTRKKAAAQTTSKKTKSPAKKKSSAGTEPPAGTKKAKALGKASKAAGRAGTTAGKAGKAAEKKKAVRPKADEEPSAQPEKTERPAKTAKASTRNSRSGRLAPRRKRALSARAVRFKQAFVASAELRPMAQQLATLRTPAAYAGVTAYAQRHSGDVAAAAYLALGHAYLADRRFAEAASSFKLANKASNILDDYADFLSARAGHEAGENSAAEALLHGFTARYPDSIFDVEAPELEAAVLLALKDAPAANRVLDAASGTATDRPGYQLARAQVALALGHADESNRLFKQVLLDHPLSPEAETAREHLTSSGAVNTLTVTELRSLGDAYYRAGRYSLAVEQYHALAHNSNLSQSDRDEFEVAAAACDLKLKRLTTAEAEALPDTDDENGARRSYLLMELARNRNDMDAQQSLVEQMKARFPRSQWLAEALFSSGNMYMLVRDYPKAVTYYNELAARFPQHKNAAAAHWRAGWLDYRQGLYAEASRMFDAQIRLFPNSTETVAALYWRARLYETQDNKPAAAAARYRAIMRAYPHYFYAQMARERLTALGNLQPVSDPAVDGFKAPVIPPLDDSFPEDSDHLARARLLANAGLNEYIPREIAADPDSGSWSALAEAQIYTSCGDIFHAMRALKRALPFAASTPIQAIPLTYWRILFPEPYWDAIKAESAKNNLDPYLVASLIRQESEFNAGAVSYANAWGLMQLLPAVGKEMAREEGLTHFETFQLLDPETNIRLGTRYLHHMIERFGGVQEYALAAYNAGDSRVADWRTAGPYSGMDEFVESIPFTQTREYVQSILRNMDMYRSIDAVAAKAKALSRH